MKSLLILAFMLFSSLGFAGHLHHQDPPSTHGMLIFGKSKIYLSHLPMFHSPHDYQVIVEAQFSLPGQAAYLTSLNGSSETVYTLVPESFVLPDLIKNPRPFTAQIYRGHFERGGVMIAENVTVDITKVIYFKKLTSTDTKPNLGTYLLFGNNEEQFLAHAIVAKPDFDQILKVKTGAITAPIMVTLNSRLNSEPIKPQEVLEATTPEGSLSIQTEYSLYLEFEDLSF